MIRVGFVLPDSGVGWLGGHNYYRNLLSAVSLLADSQLSPVVFTGTTGPQQRFGNATIVRRRMLDGASRFHRLWRASAERFPETHPLLKALLYRHSIDVLSHHLPVRQSRPTIAWIPDFQHQHLPQFFSPGEIAHRDHLYRKMVTNCDRIIVSSESVQADLLHFDARAASKCRVLRFVPEVNLQECATRESLELKYGFAGEYFYLPNQFWIHKNHRLVIQALSLLRASGRAAQVICTGNPADYRHPRHFDDLMMAARELGVEGDFRVLGVIPYADLVALMQHSIAMINPSLFEGWSSTVEEAKAMGKLVLVSDLAVHREQAAEGATYFDASRPEELAEAMVSALSRHSDENLPLPTHTRETYHRSRIEFGRGYESIVRELCQ